ncbi:MAG: Firmicu-CTERM sorting domain-containing protein [Lachnospiraceae bacterium]|nr:Firmicu-CTERM sorting domain-containing protein [Lachnospiraceae bacterium]
MKNQMARITAFLIAFLIVMSAEVMTVVASPAVDGYCEDWSGIPETMITYGSHNTGGTIYEYHGGSMLVSDGYVYVHVRMSDLYQQQIPVDELILTINGVSKSFIIRKRNADNTINWDEEVYALPGGISSDLGVFFRDGASVALGEAVVKIAEASPNDCFEFRMKISELAPLYGMDEASIENGATLQFYSPNIGPEKVTVVGSSTGTYIGIALCFAVVLAALYGQKRRKQAYS